MSQCHPRPLNQREARKPSADIIQEPQLFPRMAVVISLTLGCEISLCEYRWFAHFENGQYSLTVDLEELEVALNVRLGGFF